MFWLLVLWACCRENQMSGLYTGIRPVHIYPTSKMVSDYSGMMVQVGQQLLGVE
jgi:2-isopropylmalate synthase